MQAPRYIEANLDTARERSRSYKLHNVRLAAVKKIIDNRAPATFGRHASHSKVAERQKAETVRRVNEMLLVKLIDISLDHKYKTSSSQPRLSSLNSRSKKLEAKRIAFENTFLSQRLNKLESNLSPSKLKSEYQRVEEYKRRLSRAQWVSPRHCD